MANYGAQKNGESAKKAVKLHKFYSFFSILNDYKSDNILFILSNIVIKKSNITIV